MVSKEGVQQPRTHIICFGNLWQGDDGFGVHVCQNLAKRKLPEHVSVIEAGIAGLSAVKFFEGCERVLLIDALSPIAKIPGQIHKLTLEDVVDPKSALSSHGVGLNYLLSILPIALEGQSSPDICIFGAEINGVKTFMDQLSPPLLKASHDILNLIEQEISR